LLKPKKIQKNKHITKAMAEETAAEIQAYWAKKGYVIHVWTVNVARGVYGVRSNMENGYPCVDKDTRH
tara:strand:- start:2757 stop:2960 length:204 start_codon:yes stop_codon:yes gene_type:complete